MLKVATWNVNGIRAREAQVREWMAAEKPDVLCLQEIKARPDQVPTMLFETEGYWCYWHGGGGYSGVALHFRKDLALDRPACFHPDFDHETRIVTAQMGAITFASIYVPNGNKDFVAKLRFLEAMERFVRERHLAGETLILCGDLNVALTDQDVHPKERKPEIIGQRSDERQLLSNILNAGVVDVGRTLDPDNAALFTWWAPWRNLRQRNIGWRLDYILASRPLAEAARSSAVFREVGTSDHAPVVAVFDR